MKRAQPQTAQSGLDAALQYRILAMGRVQAAFGAHTIKARAFFLGLSEPEKRRIAADFAAKIAGFEPTASRARLLDYLGQIHGDLASSAARSLASNRAPARPSLRARVRAKAVLCANGVRIPANMTEG